MSEIHQIERVLYGVPNADPISIPLRHLAVFGVTRDSGKTTFIESAVAASGLRAITFRTKRGELPFEGASPLPLFFDEKGLTHWRNLEGLISATLQEKVRGDPGVRAAIMRVCRDPGPAPSLDVVHERVRARLAEPRIRGFERDVYEKLDAYLGEVLPQLSELRNRFTSSLDLPASGVYLEDLEGLSDEIQSLLIASLMRKAYEEMSGVIIVLPEVWKFLPQDRGSPVKWILEKYVREMGAVHSYLWIDAQDLRGVDKKHLRSVDVRLFGRQPDPHEIEDLLKALPLPMASKPKAEQIMTLKLGHFWAKLRDSVSLVYVRPRWLPEEVALRVAKGELNPDSAEVQSWRSRGSAGIAQRESAKADPRDRLILSLREELELAKRNMVEYQEAFRSVEADAAWARSTRQTIAKLLGADGSVDKEKLRVTVPYPEMVIERSHEPLVENDGTLLGRLAIVWAEGFFSEQRSGRDVQDRMAEKGWERDPATVEQLRKLAARGFLEGRERPGHHGWYFRNAITPEDARKEGWLVEKERGR